ncbi:hypothetical protein MCUN1_001886 [Malassezia cuniculi]|uniref:H/ACA ribonucleoprotein complex non-core subunit NAF1 n=1 Tax=Malassezia cuniculi TaxID=948313 RepID=A0AAF0J6G8_9BASI|nr:hypothetical protein MCUN1_001886 [Malassezia cuniculi]
MGLEQSKLRRASLQEKNEPAEAAQPDTQVPVEPSEEVKQVTADATPDNTEESPREMTLAEQRAYVQRLRQEKGEPVTAADFPPGVVPNEILHESLREEDDSDESDSDDSDSDDSDSDDSDSDNDSDVVVQPLPEAIEKDDDETDAPPTTKHETDDLFLPPPVTQLGPSEVVQLQPIGKVHSIVNQVVLVEQLPNIAESQPAFDVLDTESLLCFEDGRVLGLVYETFGSVQHPMYSIRFPPNEPIDRDVVQLERTVYYLPSSSTYVHAGAIRNKGSDASNMWDEEVAADELEYSDDEEEAAAKRAAKEQRQNRALADPENALLGPLGGYDETRKRKNVKTRGSARGKKPRGDGNISFSGPSAAAAPHINPRFASQWLPGMPYPYAMPPGFPMQMPSASQSMHYDPRSPSVVTPYAQQQFQQPMPPGMPMPQPQQQQQQQRPPANPHNGPTPPYP